jgi:Tol biopolymer transport system component
MKVITIVALVGLTCPAVADEAGWIRVISQGKAVLVRPDGSERTDDTVPDPTPRQPSPDGKHVLWVAPAGEGSVHVAAADGAGERRLPADGVPAGSASWSPDGRRIAFLARRGDHWQVYTADADGANVRQLTDAKHGAWRPKFGPDGRLSYLIYHERVSKLQPADLVIAGDKETTAVVKNVYITDYAWSPDGTTIVYGKAGSVVFHHLATGATREVSLPDIHKDLRSHAAGQFSWSPDGKAVACTITFLGGRRAGGPKMMGDDEVFVIRRDGPTTWFRHGGSYPQIEWVKAK